MNSNQFISGYEQLRYRRTHLSCKTFKHVLTGFMIKELSILGKITFSIIFSSAFGKSNNKLFLCSFVNETLRAFDSSQCTTRVFSDLSQAFDCVDHKELVADRQN